MCQPFGATRTTAANPQCIGNPSSTSPRNQLFAHVILTTRMEFSNGTIQDISFETLRRRRCLNIATAMASFRHQTPLSSRSVAATLIHAVNEAEQPTPTRKLYPAPQSLRLSNNLALRTAYAFDQLWLRGLSQGLLQLNCFRDCQQFSEQVLSVLHPATDAVKNELPLPIDSSAGWCRYQRKI